MHHVISCQVVVCKDLTIWALCTHLTGYLYLYIRTIIFVQLYICSVAFASILSHKIPHLPTPICRCFYLPVAEAMERMDENCALLGRVLDLYFVFCSVGRVVSITNRFFHSVAWVNQVMRGPDTDWKMGTKMGMVSDDSLKIDWTNWQVDIICDLNVYY